MTDWSIWPATNGPNTDSGDSSDISRGVSFQLSATGWLKAIRFYRGTTNVGNPTTGSVVGRLYNATTGVAIAGTDVTFTPSGTGWQQANLSTPVMLSSGVLYKAVVLSGNYTATGHYFDVGAGVGGITNGIVTCPDAGGNPLGIGGIQQGSFKQPTTGLQFPNQYFQGGNYWVDVVVADTDPGSDIRDTAGTVTVTASSSATVGGKIGYADATPAVTASSSATGTKRSTAAVTTSVTAGSASQSSKAGIAAAAVAVSASTTALVSSVGAGVHAPTSTVLCSSWANFVDVPTRLRDRLPDLTETDWQTNLLRASELLWMLSGRRWLGGGCTETAELRSNPPQEGRGAYPYHSSWGACTCWADPIAWDSELLARPWGYRHIPQPYAIQLPRSLVSNIVSVMVGDTAFTDYRLTLSGWLERTDGQGWSVCDGDTVITYQFGRPPPAGGRDAAIALAFELGREQTGDSNCRLPSNVVSITRQGVTYEMQAATEFQALLRTGVPEVDRWLAAVNPNSRPQSARVWSPDIPSAQRYRI